MAGSDGDQYSSEWRMLFRKFWARSVAVDTPQTRFSVGVVFQPRSSSFAGHGVNPMDVGTDLGFVDTGPSQGSANPGPDSYLLKSMFSDYFIAFGESTRKGIPCGESTRKDMSIPATPRSSTNAVVGDTTEVSQPHTWRCSLSSSSRSTIWVRTSPDSYSRFYIRRRRSGSFQTYPDLGGPFESLREADNAIYHHLKGLVDATMCKESLDKLSLKDRLIQQSLYWPDGRSKLYSKDFALENTNEGMYHLVQALVDKHNEDHNLSGDLAYELQDVLHYQTICERHIWYYHFNFTLKTKPADKNDSGTEDLFFAEVMCTEGHELAVSSFCRIDTNANGLCYGCKNNGGVRMKHPKEANAYNAGHLDSYLPFGYDGKWDDSDGNVKAEKDRLSSLYEGLDDPDFLKEIFTLPPHATATFIED